MTARIAIVRGPDAGAKLDVAGSSVRVGTSADNDLVLTDSSVSRRHCSIEPTKGGVHIRDEGSTIVASHNALDWRRTTL